MTELPPEKTGSRRFPFAVLIATLYVLIGLPTIATPFVHHKETGIAEVSKHARNHLRFGLGVTRGASLDMSAPDLSMYQPKARYIYGNHPPVSTLIVAGVFAIADTSETSARVSQLLVGFFTIIFFGIVAGFLLPRPWNVAATVAFSFAPLWGWFSRAIPYHAEAILFLMAAMAAFLWAGKTGQKRGWVLGCVALFLATWSEWFAFLVGASLLPVYLFSRPRRWTVVLSIGSTLGVSGVLYLLFLWSFDPEGLAPIRTLFASGKSWIVHETPTIPGWIFREAREAGMYVTLPILIGTAWWALSLFRHRTQGDGLIAALAAGGILEEVVLYPSAFVHDHSMVGLAPFFALAGIRGLHRLWEALPKTPWIRWSGAAVMILLFAGPAGWILHNRLTQVGAYELYEKAGKALRDVAEPDERTLILFDSDSGPHSGYYSERYSITYSPERETIFRETSVRDIVEGIPQKEFWRQIDTGEFPLDWIMAAQRNEVIPVVGFLQILPEEELDKFNIDRPGSERLIFLEKKFGPPRRHKGFLFFRVSEK
jgi:hypothetical protein